MESEDNRMKINRLQGSSDWASWKFKKQIILEDDFISGEHPKPQRTPLVEEIDAETHIRFRGELKVRKLKDAECKKALDRFDRSQCRSDVIYWNFYHDLMQNEKGWSSWSARGEPKASLTTSTERRDQP
ncbi:hypothetical protein GE061_007124 [Apolygus lucorum]|uniref:Uncharacterized protein n=1 Tax=Apolygus lucorum TaxID=248454 RepID=A0A8S9WSB7_APOLU|nr:hypothetical protein GE061_007124 [Apolygus lucorum]